MKKVKKITLKPEWDEIEKARNKVDAFLRSLGLSDDTVDTFIMVVSELIENSIKYGNFQGPENRVIVTIHVEKRTVLVEVINPVDNSTQKHLQNLDRSIQWIRGYQDPFQAYVERLKQVSRKPLRDQESGLGLVRIAYEGRSVLDCFVSEDDLLNVSAIADL